MIEKNNDALHEIAERAAKLDQFYQRIMRVRVTVEGPGRHHRQGRCRVSVDITNTGTVTGAEIAQLYVGSPSSAATPEAPDELEGFQKVLLTAGQTRHVTFTLDAGSFRHWDTASHSWKITAGTYRILLGSGSRDIRLRGSVTEAAG